MVKSEKFDRDYFENGVASGVSGYQNYRWLPELTLVFAHKIIKRLDLREGDKVLDYGCAKGFMVHALRLLDIDAYGCDISHYAIDNAYPGIEKYLTLINEGERTPFEDNTFRYIISKDVYEHLPGGVLEETLRDSARISEKLFAIVPLGDGAKYIVPSYENDITHIHRQNRDWWGKKFEDNGWRVESFSHLIPGMKQAYSKFPKGNGFFFLERDSDNSQTEPI